MTQLNETACEVSKLFRRTADMSAHVSSIDAATGGEDFAEALGLGREVMNMAAKHTKETQRL